MLPAKNRLTHPDAFREITRRGQRVAFTTLTLHIYVEDKHQLPGQANSADPLVGFIVPKRLFHLSTRRKRIGRRLRHAMAPLISELPSNYRIVVRAQSEISGLSSTQINQELTRALERAKRKLAKTEPGRK